MSSDGRSLSRVNPQLKPEPVDGSWAPGPTDMGDSASPVTLRKDPATSGSLTPAATVTSFSGSGFHDLLYLYLSSLHSCLLMTFYLNFLKKKNKHNKPTFKTGYWDSDNR